MAGTVFVLVFLVGYINGLQEDINQQKRFIDNELSLESLQREINGLKARLDMVSHDPVAFKAHLTQSVSPSPNEHIIYDDVQLNLGGAFHEHTSVFLAPVNGTYLFSVSVCSTANHYIALELVRNNAMIGRILAGDTVYDDCSSETTITALAAGDEVFVRHKGASGDYIHVHPSTVNSFTGALLQKL